jgi:hypothetical protein
MVGGAAQLLSLGHMNWLDPQTKEILQKVVELKLAPPKTAEFTLVLVRNGPDHTRLVRAIRRINECEESEAVKLAARRTPVRVNSDLSEGDALWGQFELICCDAVSIFIRSEVVDQMDLAEFQSLVQKTSQSTEFQPTTVTITEIPQTESGLSFVDQFLGSFELSRDAALPSVVVVPFKKARIMQHWATRVGAKLQCQTN